MRTAQCLMKRPPNLCLEPIPCLLTCRPVFPKVSLPAMCQPHLSNSSREPWWRSSDLCLCGPPVLPSQPRVTLTCTPLLDIVSVFKNVTMMSQLAFFFLVLCEIRLSVLMRAQGWCLHMGSLPKGCECCRCRSSQGRPWRPTQCALDRRERVPFPF